MKKLILLSIVLIVGCDYAPTEHSHDTEHEHGELDVYGCTNSYAENYLYGYNQACKESIDSDGNCIDDGSCIFKVYYEVSPLCLVNDNDYFAPTIDFTIPGGGYLHLDDEINNGSWHEDDHNFSHQNNYPMEGCLTIRTRDFYFRSDEYYSLNINSHLAGEPLNGVYPNFILYISDLPADTVEIVSSLSYSTFSTTIMSYVWDLP